jgi:hypothetical protein
MERISVDLSVPKDAARFLSRLQARFAMACDFTAEEARRSGCFARVALHHALYNRLREKFADLGAQMACNAIYTVARTYRQLRAKRPHARWGADEAPRLRFARTAPVFFDRHTLSLRGSRVSMFTLDGRLRFDLKLGPEREGDRNAGAHCADRGRESRARGFRVRRRKTLADATGDIWRRKRRLNSRR